MRILLINSMCGLGSTGRIVADLYKRLILDGNTVKVAYGLGEATIVPKQDTYRINNRVGYYMHNLLAKITDKTGLFSSCATKRLIKWIDEFNPDIVHLHNLHGYYINYKILFEYLSEKRIRVIWTLHDCWSFTGHCAHFDMVKCEKWKNGCKSCVHKKLYPKSYFCSRAQENYKLKKRLFSNITDLTIVCPSHWLAELAKESFLNIHPIRVIYNGIDRNSFFPRESRFREKYGLQDNFIILGVANNWNRAKGFDDFLKLSKSIDKKYVVVLVGLTKVQKDQIPHNILGIERTSNVDELAEIYSASDVFLNLTYEDTFPTVNMEALACGTPVITYSTGGSGEIIDSDSGIQIEQGNLPGVIDALQSITHIKMNDAIKRSELFDKKFRYEEYVKLYYHLD